jgi:hypothetical protein
MPILNYPAHSRHVLGYTGHLSEKPITEQPVKREPFFLEHAPPGFKGFVPRKQSESLFGRSFSVVACACAKNVHGR